MPISFPNNPVTSDKTVTGLSNYIWNGSQWEVLQIVNPKNFGIQGIQGIQGTTLGESNYSFYFPAASSNYFGSTSSINIPAGSYYVYQNSSNTKFTLGNTSITGSGVITTTSSSTYASITPGTLSNIAWTTRSTGQTSGGAYTLAYGNGTYVIAGSNAKISSSTDGITWTTRTSPLSTTYNINKILYAQSNFLAANDSGDLLVSTNGITWTTRTTPATSLSMTTLSYGNGVWVMSGLYGAAYTSTNGTSWTAYATGWGGVGSTFDGIFANGIHVLVGTQNKISTSTDGITWTLRTSPLSASNYFYSITYGNGLFVAGGDGGVVVSTDGITWTSRNASITGSIYAAGYGNGQYILGNASGQVSSSTDGITWSLKQSPNVGIVYDILYVNFFLVCGTNVFSLNTSPNVIGINPTDKYVYMKSGASIV